MKYTTYLTLGMLAAMAACGSKEDSLEGKKAELAGLREELVSKKEEIRALEQEILKIDPDAFNASGNRLNVATLPVNPTEFQHKIDIRGEVQSRKNVMLSGEMMGRLLEIHAYEGARVKKGQLLMHLDAEQLENSIAEVKTSLEFAEKMYTKRKSLWDKNVGSEVQYLEAKNNFESLQRKLATLNSQLDMAYIKAPFSGQVDQVLAKTGEIVQPGMPLMRLTGNSDMYITAEVSERYLGKFHRGDEVTVNFPSLDKSLTSTISSVGQVINKNNRTFSLEVKLKEMDELMKPNLLAVIEATDYTNDSAVVVPTKLIQKDNEGHFVFIVGKDEGKEVAKKARVELGKTFRGQTEIATGLETGDVLITEGYRDAAENTILSIIRPTADSGE
ncbi:efflux RND transporter periplasmic adaptor subunit [Persicobacter sp. CCB-QB2]|uniref:efflux RND transporter periplasmic adaptor subunit n=1 Tax=Persicobacter sp. CCB-QB2 TaxID=1561025 RepID=UPI0006A9F4E2|nr:efflux RND transporter periplasmic adaptor subunit [Persicobacter sp. CCB-QB2]